MARYCGCPNKDKCYGGTNDNSIVCKFKAMVEGKLQDWSQSLGLVVNNDKKKDKE